MERKRWKQKIAAVLAIVITLGAVLPQWEAQAAVSGKNAGSNRSVIQDFREKAIAGRLSNGRAENQDSGLIADIASISLGEYHSGAVTKDGELYMWGDNWNGQLGDGTTENRQKPIKALDNVASVSLGCSHSGAVTKDGGLYMWGDNGDGRLGDGTTEDRQKPIKVLDNVASVGLGYYHSGAVTKDGRLYMWGYNRWGQLGDGTTTYSNKPIKVLDNVASVSLGEYHSGAVTKDGRLYMWGNNWNGQLGDGTTEDRQKPIKVLDNVASISLGEEHSGAVTKDGRLYMWGYNRCGQLGDGTTIYSNKPIKVLDNVASISLGEEHSGAVTKGGRLYMWGSDFSGQLGDGTISYSNKPITVLYNVASISLGGLHSGAVTKDGELYMWGYNAHGQLGDGTTGNRYTPVKIPIKTSGSNADTPGNISTFTLSSSATGAADSSFPVFGALTLKDDVEVTKELWERETAAIQWTSSDQSILPDSGIVCNGSNLSDSHSISLMLMVKPQKEGTVIITGTAGSFTQSCVVTVTEKKAESSKKYVSGILSEFNMNLWTVAIGDTEYAVTDDFNLNSVAGYLGKKVVAVLENNKVSQLYEGKKTDGNDVSSVTQTDDVDYISYDVIHYKTTPEGRIVELAEQLNRAINNYLQKVENAMKKDAKAAEDSKTMAQKLKEADRGTKDRAISMVANTPDDVVDSVYEAYAIFLNDYVQEGINLKEIDLKKDKTLISIELVNQISNSIGSVNKKIKAGEYTVQFKTTTAFGAYAGTVEVTGKGIKTPYLGGINSTSVKTAEIMTQYIDELSKLVKDLYKEALMSVISELGQVTGISEYTKKGWEAFFKDIAGQLQNSRWKKVPETIVKLRELYDIMKKLLKNDTSGGMINSFKEISSMCDTLLKMPDYSDEDIQDKSVTMAMNQVNRIKNNLVDEIFNYIYGTDNGYISPEEKLQTLKKIILQCPVEAEVYDTGGKLLGSTENGEDSFSKPLIAQISGDVKTIYVPDGMDVQIKLTATADGVMNYTVEEIRDGVRTGRMNYYNVPLAEGSGYFQNLPSTPMETDTRSLPLASTTGGKIYADEYLSASEPAVVKIDYTADEGGVISGEKIYAKGDSVELAAYTADDSYEFEGWYIDGTLVELKSICRFTAQEDTSIRAAFIKKQDLVQDTDYQITLGSSYSAFACVRLYQKEAGMKDILMNLKGAGGDAIDYASVIAQKYSASGNLLASDTFGTDYDSGISFWLHNIDFNGCAKVKLLDKKGNLIVVFEQNAGNMPSASPVPTVPGISNDGSDSSGSSESNSGDKEDIQASPVPIVTPAPVPAETPGNNTDSNEPPADSTAKPDDTDNSDSELSAKEPSSIKNGTKFTLNGIKYKITSISGKTVKVTGIKKNRKTVMIPASIQFSGRKYKVTSIAKNALKNKKKITKLTIGRNIKVIGRNAMAGCKNLKSIIIKTKKLTDKTVGTRAFRGISSKAKIKVPKSKLKSYKKIINAKGANKKVKVIK